MKIFEFVDLFAAANLDEVRTALGDVVRPVDTHPGSVTPVPPDLRGRANDVRAAREELILFLGHSAMTEEAPALQEAYQSILSGKFGPAHRLLGRVHSHRDLPAITPATIDLAFSGPISFGAFIKGGVDAEGEPTIERVTRTICQGYKGPPVSATDIVALNKFFQPGAARKSLLDNEALQGIGTPPRLVEAIHSYALLLPEAATKKVNVLGAEIRLFQHYVALTGPRQILALPGVFVTSTGPARGITPVQQFAALRSAFAYLKLGDVLFRRHRILSTENRRLLCEVYEAAVRIVTDSAISPGNALRGQVITHAGRQCRLLRAGLNVLGLSEDFVPVMRWTALQAAADNKFQQLAQAAEGALNSLAAAQSLIGQQMNIVHELNEETLRTGILVDQIAIAGLEEGKSEEQVALIRDQLDVLAAQTMAGWASRISSAITSPQSFVGGALITGFIESSVNHFARSTELGHQLDIAKADVEIAEIRSHIAETELSLSQRRIQHLDQRLNFLTDNRVDADLYLTLAELHERRAARVLDTAILLAYLAERAWSFARGQDAPLIRFDYWDNPSPDTVGETPEDLDPLARLNAATDSLSKDLGELHDQDLHMSGDALRTFQIHISLSQHYPLEYARLLQDGETYFEYSLYQLNKDFPFSYMCRIYAVAVQIDATGPASGPRGVLEHTGAFLLRHKDVRDTTRLVPTELEVRRAREEQRTEGRGVSPVGGVLSYVLEKNPIISTEIFSSPLLPVNAPNDLKPEALREGLEGYGPTGLWRLELHNLEELRIGDITIHFGVVAGVDTGDLETKIEQLVHDYETELAPNGEPLDKISGFSLQELFPDSFGALRTGTASVPLERKHFPASLTNLQFKALVLQATDNNDKGVEGIRLRYGRADANFQRERVSGRGGFSEDLDSEPETLPLDDRFPVEGPWQITLLDGEQAFTQLGDLRLFVMYSYQ
ncbi:hypothetical protein [Arthrobacter ruber]|uniref:Tc toxin subunit A-related protein n=1 Tax=Arthrobacter ruber TaxID=1258893 RepID=UPI0012FFE65C|nr:hypothetical protein [Arthrobacter ruber]